MAEVAWIMPVLGWIISPIATRLITDGFALLGFDEYEKMRDLEARLLPQLAIMLELPEMIPAGQRGHIELWAKRLRAAFYDAEDILDIADYHRLQKQVLSYSGNNSAIDRAKHIFSGKTLKLKKALKKLEKVIEQGYKFTAPLASTISSGRNNGNGTTSCGRDEYEIATISSPPHTVFGRDKDRGKITEILRKGSSDSEPSSSNNQEKCYTVIGIYGIAGSGKTTLAQYVCTYERNDNYFSPIMWIHVSQSFSVSRIYQQMLEAAMASSGSTFHEWCNLDNLHTKLEEQLRCKRFFLVLDNMRAGIDVHVLDQLFSPLKVGRKGSMVLITTRFKETATSLASLSMKIPDLSENDFFNLFMHYALDGADFDPKDLETFIMIGKQIVAKLKASPLAARIVGARLRKKLKPASWRAIGDQDMLHDTMGALWWSYQQFDEQVRRCFAYFSMFPQGYRFTCEELIDLWIAEGFTKSEQIDNVGQNCFDELVSCSFLSTEKYVYGSKDEWFTLHDLIHELAARVAGSDCFRIEEMGNLFINLRRLKIASLPKLQKLPTLPNSLKSLDIQQCDALVVTCREDVDMVRSLFVRRASQYEPSLNTTVHAEEINTFANEQPDRFGTILSDIFGRCGSLPTRLIRNCIQEAEYSQFELPASVDRVIISYCVVTDTVLHNSLRGSTSLTSLNLRGLPFLTAIPSEVMQSLPKLSDIAIEECVNFTLIQGLNSLTKLQHLSITKCPNLATLDEKVCGLHGVAVDNIPLLARLLSAEGCSSLWSLRIHESEELREEEILQRFCSLACLEFSCCNWNHLPENLAILTSLEHLHLDYCRSVRSLPTLPASLRSFELTDCDLSFMKSCQKAGDPNWHKIAHIPVKRFFP
ncbi:hypothetical protein PR202_ga31631 [Eleusine coracana subsp. coracana]|uniref:Uncharacterized protein n=1 Tax=Eleusine coracana subsp. coracana TaxID=191504 RepID=A0AAV5DRY9_ELECO|nr:hypothetical protein PR202_ga31631 [Eleusine coracana subsp. coracana]